MAAGTTRAFVVAPTGSRPVVAYYAWTMALIEVADAALTASTSAQTRSPVLHALAPGPKHRLAPFTGPARTR